MTENPSSPEALADQLQSLLLEAGLPSLRPEAALQMGRYVALFVRWNARTNLSAIREESAILRRHVLESIALAGNLPEDVATVLDFGSGGGLPGIPLGICRPALHITLAESQNKKAAFLREAVRLLQLNAAVHASRAELLASVYDCVTLRAVDRMEQAVSSASLLVRSGGYLVLMTTTAQLPSLQHAAGPAFTWPAPLPLPGSEQAVIALARRA